jgi:thiol-disulfide isomerase/thioredoxin
MQDKKLIALLALSVALAAIAGRMIIDSRTLPTTSTETVVAAAAIHDEYPDLPKDNVIVNESASAIIDRFKTGSGIIFLGFKECPWCQKLLPLANDIAAAKNEKIYYLDIRALRENNAPEYQQLISILSPHLEKDENDTPRIYVPDMSIVKEGEIIGRYEMEETEEKDLTPDSYWTEERKERAKQTLGKQIEDLQDKAPTKRPR